VLRLLLVLACALALAPAASAAAWSGGWTNAATGTHGHARLTATALQLDGSAFGCAEPVTLRVRVSGGRVSGRGSDLPCSAGLRWTISGGVARPTIEVRAGDGSYATLKLVLQRRK
jgi:opacity protein-like surface antigen